MAVCIAVVVFGWIIHSQLFEYVPMFGLGVVMAYEQDRFRALTIRMKPLQWSAALGLSLLLMTSYWDMWGLGLGKIASVGQGLSALGACGVFLIMRDCVSAIKFGESGVIQWLGKRSFSLYLIHEPIVLTIVFALGGKPNVALTFALALPIVLMAAEGFFRAVEHPSHLLAQAVGRKVKSYTTKVASPEAA
jgi:peptidoglycan/LPS O-acetylase OafA/YrhL